MNLHMTYTKLSHEKARMNLSDKTNKQTQNNPINQNKQRRRIQMMNNNLKKLGVTSLLVMSLLSTSVFASTEDFGASGASDESSFTLEAMLEYAIEDEYLAHDEYELIINELDAARPFTNIIKAEEAHIQLVEGLYETYGLELPIVDASAYTAIPESIEAALEAGVSAEISNIAMYEQFLAQDLPDDVRIVFEYLKKGSESHLAAFEGSNGAGQSGNQSGTQSRGNGNSNRGNNTDRQYFNQSEDCILTDI